MATPRYFTSEEAARELGVKVPTLYAYVSRGIIRSEPAGGRTRSRRYNAEDVRALNARKERGRSPAAAARSALDWGGPVMDSALTLITERALYYRGHDATRLARRHTLEEVAILLWTGEAGVDGLERRGSPDGRSPARRRGMLSRAAPVVTTGRKLAPIDRMLAALPLLAAEDAAAYQLSTGRVVETGLRIIAALAAAAVGVEAAGAKAVEAEAAEAEGGPSGGVARTFARGWGHASGWGRTEGRARAEGPGCAEGPGRGNSGLEALLDAALILCADHELNTSTLAARCAASTRASPYGVVMAGMATLQGPRHGGAAGRVEAMMAEASSGSDPTEVVAARLRRGEGIPGFGHPLYPEGDPRATTLMGLLAEEKPGLGEAAASRLALSEDLAAEVERLTDRRPNIDFALAALTATMGFPSGSALALFAVGRTVGWIAHAIEQYGLEELIRPRARYVGPAPEGAP